MTGIIHDCEQGTPEWLTCRARCIMTASEAGPFLIGTDKRSEGARQRIILRAVRRELADMGAVPVDEWERAKEEKESRAMEYNFDVQRGNALEPEALQKHSDASGLTVSRVGFVTTPDGNFGCSPDGICIFDQAAVNGIETKCPMPETFIRWALAGGVPDEHIWQVEFSIAITWLPWQFVAYCRGFRPLSVRVEPSATTTAIRSAMAAMAAQKADIMRKVERILI